MKWLNPIVWVDLEATGLKVDTDVIVEIAVIITDGKLENKVEGPNIVIHAASEKLATMNDWCRETFSKSGLLNEITQSTWTIEAAERKVLDFLVEQGVTEGIAPLAGNSVGWDRCFLMRHMPLLHNFLHYRTLDVSTLKLIKNFWFPTIPDCKKELQHRALADIRESISELSYYQQVLFR